MNTKKLQLKRQVIIFFSIVLLMISIFIETKDVFSKEEYDFSYEYVNIKDMSQARVQIKKDDTNVIDKIMDTIKEKGQIQEMAIASNLKEEKTPQTEASQIDNRPVWRLPVEMGTITQYPSYYHPALDITSPRTYSEPIFPVANGTISSIYRDNAGALIVTVLHNINGKNYTSQYVHMWKYADGIYVGKPVTVNDVLGYMGSTGNSTGPHLHIALADCALYDATCPNIGAYLNRASYLNSQGYLGLGSHINMPHSWTSR